MRWIILFGMLVFAGCDAPQPPRAVYSLPPPTASQAEWQSCLEQEIGRRVSETWAASAAVGEYPPSVIAHDKAALSGRDYSSMDEIPAAALEKCLQSYKRGSKYSGSYPEVLADSIYGTAKGRYEAQIRNS